MLVLKLIVRFFILLVRIRRSFKIYIGTRKGYFYCNENSEISTFCYAKDLRGFNGI